MAVDAFKVLTDTFIADEEAILWGLKRPDTLSESFEALREKSYESSTEALGLIKKIQRRLQDDRDKDIGIAARYVIREKAELYGFEPGILFDLLDTETACIRETAVWILALHHNEFDNVESIFVKLLEDPAPSVRKHAAWGLGYMDNFFDQSAPFHPFEINFIPGFSTVSHGFGFISVSGDPGSNNDAKTDAGALFYLIDAIKRATFVGPFYIYSEDKNISCSVKDNVQDISELLEDLDPDVRQATLWTLAHAPFEIDKYASLVEAVLTDPEEHVRSFAVRLVRLSGQRGCLFSPTIEKLLKDQSEEVRRQAVDALLLVNEKDRLNVIAKLLSNENKFIRDVTAQAIVRLNYFKDDIIGLLEKSFHEGSLWSGAILTCFGPKGMDPLLSALEIEDRDICGMALICLGWHGGCEKAKDHIERISEFKKHKDGTIRLAAEHAIVNITRKKSP
jgi:HEAT repeat protein